MSQSYVLKWGTKERNDLDSPNFSEDKIVAYLLNSV